jgi:hypothetical protein
MHEKKARETAAAEAHTLAKVNRFRPCLSFIYFVQ